jgi:hypothetical protein
MSLHRLAYCLLPLLLCIQPAAAQQSGEDGVKQALDRYVLGLRDGNAAKLREAFLDEGRFCLRQEKEGKVGIQCDAFSAVLDSWVKQPDPATSGRVKSMNIQPNHMASVDYELDFGGRRYADHLLLYKTADRWVIVAKTTRILR